MVIKKYPCYQPVFLRHLPDHRNSFCYQAIKLYEEPAYWFRT
jgi:hypothetical protein